MNSEKERSFSRIKAHYNAFYQDLLRRGKLPLRSTPLGFWGSAVADEVFTFFSQNKNAFNKKTSFIDLGSGDGKVVLIASLFFDQVHGIECDNELHETAQQATQKLNIQNATFYKQDFHTMSLKKFDVIFMNPDKRFSGKLEQKFANELKGSLIIYGNHFHPTSLNKKNEEIMHATKITTYHL